MPFRKPWSASKFAHTKGVTVRMNGHVYISDEEVYRWHAELEAEKAAKNQAWLASQPIGCSECNVGVALEDDYLCQHCRDLNDELRNEQSNQDLIREAMERGYRQGCGL